jgi:hypothetical protein
MGLDIEMFRMRETIPFTENTDFPSSYKTEKGLVDWRRESGLFYYFRKLYIHKGGKDWSFNGANLRIHDYDLIVLNVTISEWPRYLFGPVSPDEGFPIIHSHSPSFGLITEKQRNCYSEQDHGVESLKEDMVFIRQVMRELGGTFYVRASY